VVSGAGDAEVMLWWIEFFKVDALFSG
jgi:hypothetical protein